MKKTTAKKPAAKPIKPAKGKGSGKPNFRTRAKLAGVSLDAKDPTIPEIVMEVDPDLMAAMGARGRPTKLTPELGSRIVTLYARGEDMEELVLHDGMPDWSTIYAWLAAPESGVNGPLYKAFRQAFARAKELRSHTRLGKIEAALRRTASTKAQRDAGLDGLDPSAARVFVDGQRILMELENRRDYGKQLTLKGDKDAPLHPRTRHDLTDEELELLAAGQTLDKLA